MKCSKRHKLWSQCSGVRDPAAYVKRSELATPAGIDRDFNFLASVERKFENVEKECAERGIDVATPDAQSHRPPQKGEYNMKRSIENCGVIVEMAPKGIQRAKENLTHWNKKQRCLAWTVEWIYGDGQRSLCTALESLSIEAGYSRLKGGSQPTSSKKRKLDHAGELETTPNTDEVETAALTLTEPQRETETENNSPPVEYHFYLLRPRTPSPLRVLIPLSKTNTLSASLKDRVVLEFPTIYVLSEPPSALPEGFILESQYLDQSAESSSSVDTIISRITPPELHQEAVTPGVTVLDEERISDVLYKDLVASSEGV
ncbi:hypothetical protein FGG08_000383 [Glutinoglossum americanum]|uniref:BCD1 alpha/beta domain-containing protein n=1 Tax=Glutinoglossum americanum TaxID=1670608 RepID=A0A9P8IAD8_9PEZI|nr:hypothetical protein FGG08_000383 [Glutinoglossum americanum]